MNIIKNNKIHCSVYYHWSGYTASAFEEVSSLLNIIEHPDRRYYAAPNKRLKLEDAPSDYLKWRGLKDTDFIDPVSTPTSTTSDWLLRLIHCLENKGGGLYNDSKNYAAARKTWPDEVFSDQDHTDRNEGLIAITSETMKKANGWAEHLAEINLDDQTVMIFLDTFSKKDVLELLEVDPLEQHAFLRAIPKAPFDLSKPLSFKQIADAVNGSIDADFQTSLWKNPNQKDEFFHLCS